MLLASFSLPVLLELPFLKIRNKNIGKMMISDYFLVKLLDFLLGLFMIKFTAPYVIEHL